MCVSLAVGLLAVEFLAFSVEFAVELLTDAAEAFRRAGEAS